MMLLQLADTLVIFLAASLAKPLQPVLDDFSSRTGIVIQRESGASLEHVRKITELHRVPDILWLADADVFPKMLVPKYAAWYAEIARNRMVIAYTSKSKHANDINGTTWTRILRRDDVAVGRTDPNLAPAGYRTLLLFQLAERYYHAPGLAQSLLEHAPTRNIRPNAAELAALLATGELDYIYDYQSVAEANGFRFVQLPTAIDLGDPAHAADYAKATVTVRGAGAGSTTTVAGEPILYGLAVPLAAPHRAAAARFLDFLTSPTVAARLRASHVDMLEHPVVIGNGAPVELHGATRR